MKKAILLDSRKAGALTLVLALCLVAKADFVFGPPQSLGPVINSTSSDYGPCVSADGLELYFCSERAGGFGAADIWVSKRQSVNDPWESPVNIGSTVNSSSSESYPSLSSDGLTLYFSDAYTGTPRPGGQGGGDLRMATRPSRNAPWGEPVNMGTPINSTDLDMSPAISGDGLTLIFNSRNRAGGLGSWDLWMSTRSGLQDPWGQPVNLGSGVSRQTVWLCSLVPGEPVSSAVSICG
jgi:OOP family OmpA-OmpF porin